jgi:hypothetical protein
VADPRHSDRHVADTCDLDHHAVGRLRRELERDGTVTALRRRGRGKPWLRDPRPGDRAALDDELADDLSGGRLPLNQGFVHVTLQVQYIAELPPTPLSRAETAEWSRDWYSDAVVIRAYARSFLDDGAHGWRNLIEAFATDAHATIAKWGWPLEQVEDERHGVRRMSDTNRF